MYDIGMHGQTENMAASVPKKLFAAVHSIWRSSALGSTRPLLASGHRGGETLGALVVCLGFAVREPMPPQCTHYHHCRRRQRAPGARMQTANGNGRRGPMRTQHGRERTWPPPPPAVVSRGATYHPTESCSAAGDPLSLAAAASMLWPSRQTSRLQLGGLFGRRSAGTEGSSRAERASATLDELPGLRVCAAGSASVRLPPGTIVARQHARPALTCAPRTWTTLARPPVWPHMRWLLAWWPRQRARQSPIVDVTFARLAPTSKS